MKIVLTTEQQAILQRLGKETNMSVLLSRTPPLIFIPRRDHTGRKIGIIEFDIKSFNWLEFTGTIRYICEMSEDFYKYRIKQHIISKYINN